MKCLCTLLPLAKACPPWQFPPSLTTVGFTRAYPSWGKGNTQLQPCLPFLSAKKGGKKRKEKKKRKLKAPVKVTIQGHKLNRPQAQTISPRPHVTITSLGLPCNKRISDEKNEKAQT